MAKQNDRATKAPFDLSGKRALVRGGSRGLGLQMALALGEQGAELVLVARTQCQLDEALDVCHARGIHAVSMVADLACVEETPDLLRKILECHGEIDTLVNNAGVENGGALVDMPLAEWDRVMGVNIRSVFALTQATGRHMVERRIGRVVNIAYDTSKGALVNFTRALAGESGRYGITVNAIAPGWFPTEMTHDYLTPERVARIAAATPLGCIGDGEGLKGAVVLFASDAGKHITGQILAVDGGMTAVY